MVFLRTIVNLHVFQIKDKLVFISKQSKFKKCFAAKLNQGATGWCIPSKSIILGKKSK